MSVFAVGWLMLGAGLAVFLPTFILSAGLPLLVKPWLVRLGVMDVPNARSSHERPVLRGLGLAVLIAILVVEVTFTGFFVAIAPSEPVWAHLLVITLGTAASGLLGFSEDLRGISVPVRSVILLAIASAAVVALLRVANSGLAGPDAPRAGALSIAAMPGWGLVLLGVYGVLFISSYINVANFMDGLNGISGFHGVIAGFTFAAAGIFMGGGHTWLVVAGLALAAGFAGFLPWNLSRPGAFLGDVGSYLLGGAVAITSFAALLAGVPVLATIGPMVIYFGDVGTTLVRRMRAGHKWHEPHKEHAYQRLQQLGLSHVAASGINAAFTAAAAGLGLLSIFLAPGWHVGLLAAGLALVVLYQFSPRLLARARA